MVRGCAVAVAALLFLALVPPGCGQCDQIGHF